MTYKLKATALLRRLRKNTSGQMALTWAMTMAGVTFSVGSAYDFTQVSKAKGMAQLAADNMALAASIAVDFDNEDKYVENQNYDYTDMGGPSEDFTGSMIGSVQYDVDDDGDGESNLLARATVTGTYETAFMGMIGVDVIEFQAVSDVAYAQRQGSPASIFFVTDNSGSMGWHDQNGVVKISSLKSSMINFMATLNDINSNGNDIFRSALYPYNTNLITSKMVDPDWGTLTNNNINLMSANGGTRSTSALSRAATKFTQENQAHQEMHGDDKPLKFLVFMSDGANNGATTQTVCEIEDVWVEASDEYWLDTYHGWNHIYYSYERWFDRWFIYFPATDGYFEEQEVCTEVPYSPVNEASLVHCTTMKNAGVKIYSIAYDIDGEDRVLAEKFMKDCSSNYNDNVYFDEGYYKYASSGADLATVFGEIGAEVVAEVIRVKR